MSEFHLEVTDNRTAVSPGEVITGVAGWDVEKPPRSATLRLFWYTQGRGNTNQDVAKTHELDVSKAADAQAFEFDAPNGPYSYSGILISVCWAIELIVEPGHRVKRVDLTIGPNGEEIRGRAISGAKDVGDAKAKMMKMMGSRR